ncbi:hypothetical protein [Ferruginibacter sp.]|uniref:hypothetical protein n=1 Tax=Ferruginibacter sp. TaxID=1940288 RepID=UPI00265B5EE7|nr:hypothetical protein [Ferruginibacter sp.]
MGIYFGKDITIKITLTKEKNNLNAEATGQEKFILSNTGKDTFGFVAAGLVIVFY